ncbi:hypothetical protein D3C73_1205250 [compost metagenome]
MPNQTARGLANSSAVACERLDAMTSSVPRQGAIALVYGKTSPSTRVMIEYTIRATPTANMPSCSQRDAGSRAAMKQPAAPMANSNTRNCGRKNRSEANPTLCPATAR